MRYTDYSNSLRTDIIPKEQIIVESNNLLKELNLKAICIFAACGFFLAEDCYYLNQKALKPGHLYSFGPNGEITSEKPYFRWHYSPRNISFKEAVEDFSQIFNKIIFEQGKNSNLVLPISGGLDSRTIAGAIYKNKLNAFLFSYEFQGGIRECKYGKSIAKACNLPYKCFKIPRGYLWDKISKLAEINECYTEFTHPRQMAIIDEFKAMGDLFLLGHWGDVFFSSMNVPNNLPFDLQVNEVLKKILKKSGIELGTALWKEWGLEGNFFDFLHSRIEELLGDIKIENANSRIRAFKSLYWAPRWTSINLKIFSQNGSMFLPYYHPDICEFICSTPEEYLHNRKIQIEFLKESSPILAKIPWQSHHPFNLFNAHLDKFPFNGIPKIIKKSESLIRKIIGKNLIERNWELQFLGVENEKQVENLLFNKDLNTIGISKSLIQKFYQNFKKEPVQYSHSISTLLTLKAFQD